MNTMRFNEKIICGCLLTFSILTLFASVFIVVFDLIPSMKFAKTYIPSNCKVLNDYINTTIISNQKECIELNSQIWWYNVLGENDFYDYVVQHKNSNNDNNNNSNNNNNSSSDSSYDSSSSDSSYNSNSGYINNNTDSSDGNHNHNPNERICYQGLFEVEYQIDNELLISNISGTWSVNLKWVHHYLNAFSIDETYQCFYQSSDNLNINWFGPAKYSIFSLVGISVGGGFSLFCFILFLILYRKFKGSSIKNSYIRISPDGTHTFY